jgi:hypothetical protein
VGKLTTTGTLRGTAHGCEEAKSSAFIHIEKGELYLFLEFLIDIVE